MDIGAIISDGLSGALGPIAALYALAAMGLNLHFGYTGLLNFGQVGFMLVGAYGLAVSVAIYQLPFAVGILIAILAAALLALILGIPTLRLRADYLAITTIAAAEILRFVFRSGPATDITAGVFGIPSQISESRGFADTFYSINPIPQGTYLWGLNFSANRLWVTIILWAVAGLLTFMVYRLANSPWGRVLKSIREDEDAARALGKNVFSFKMQSLVMGGVLGGLGGVGLALSQASVSPDTFLPQVTFFAFTIMILGGAGSVLGPLIGSVIFWFLISASDTILRQGEFVPSDRIGAVRLGLVGVGLVALMIYRPQGIFGSKQEMMLDA